MVPGPAGSQCPGRVPLLLRWFRGELGYQLDLGSAPALQVD